MTLGLADKAAIASAMCRDERISGDQYRVGCAIMFSFHNTGTGRCYPSFRQLAEASHTSQGTVLRAIKALEDAGYIAVERSDGGRNQRNSYTIKCSTSGAFKQGNTPLAEQKHSTSGAPCSTSGARNTPLVIDALNTGIKHRNKTQEGTQEGDHAFKAFCLLAAEKGLSEPRLQTKGRLTKINKLIATHGAEAWQQALDEIAASKFLCGENKRGWKPNVDWLLNPENFVKVIEGTYRNGASRGGNSTSEFLDVLESAKGEVRNERFD